MFTILREIDAWARETCKKLFLGGSWNLSSYVNSNVFSASDVHTLSRQSVCNISWPTSLIRMIPPLHASRRPPIVLCFRHIPILFVTLTNSEKDLPFICGKDSTFTCHIQPKVDWLCIARCYNYDQWAHNFGATLALSLLDVCRSFFKLENNELAARKNWCFDWHTLPIFRKKEKKAYRLKWEM